MRFGFSNILPKKNLFLVSHVSIDAHQSKEKVLGLQAVLHLLEGGARNQRSPLEKHQYPLPIEPPLIHFSSQRFSGLEICTIPASLGAVRMEDNTNPRLLGPSLLCVDT